MKLYFLRKSKQTRPTPQAYLSVIHLARSGLVPIPSYGREVGSGRGTESRVGLLKYVWAGNYVQYRTVTN